MTASRYVVGIDLGTTNCTLAYIDTGAADAETARPVQMLIPQVIQPNVVEARPVLPSFLYLPGGSELPAGSLKLPWDPNREFVVGELARKQGAAVPTRLISSAKSWLCHPGIDRKGPVLPWKAADDVKKRSPLEASTLYLRHLVEAWNHTIASNVPSNRLEQQEIILTVPASFDAVARELTVEAARAAGLEHITLLEEPQAAFYAWIDASGDQWRKLVEVGDVVLICDVGGGTTDLSLIAVSEEKGRLVLDRVAVGDHILLGGDNMDLALAQTMNQVFAQKNVKLDSGQMLQLWHACREAKEQLFADPKLDSAQVTVLGRSSRVIAGTIKGDLPRTDLERVLIQGFFPECARNAEPQRHRAAGLQEIGLPYASDAAITRHLAHFLSRHADQLAQKTLRAKTTSGPTAVLFNGGVFKALSLRNRVVDVLNTWGKESGIGVKTLQHDDLDLAVSRGAAYFGLVRRGKGVRIRGGAARSYYIGIETSLPAVPGFPSPIKALCVAPFGMEEGTEAEVPGQEFGLVVGEEVQFRFLGASTRRTDAVGHMVEDWQDEIEELAPVETNLEPQGPAATQGKVVPVRLQSKVTEIGTLEIWCHSRDNQQRWKLEFNVREKPA